MKHFLILFSILTYSISWGQMTTQEIFVVDSNNDTLWGTLTLPQKNIDTAQTVMLIIAGSGPTDRDGNNSVMKNNSLKYLSQDIAKMGFPSIRYDKRGVGKSKNAYVPEKDLRFQNNIDDAKLFYDLLIYKGFKKITIAGHSEGSLIGMLLANETNAYKFISISGAGRPINEVLKEQYKATAPIVRDSAYSILDSLTKGVKVDTLSPWLYSIFRPQIQDYIMSWIRLNPQSEIIKFQGPILIIQGDEDMQVSVEDANLLKQANPAAQLKITPGMNHVLKKVSSDKTENKKSYNQPELPLHPDFVFEITRFLKE